MIEVKVRGLNELMGSLEDLEKVTPLEMRHALDEASGLCLQIMKDFAPTYSGYLKNAIRRYETEDGFEIRIPYYGKWVEEGHVFRKPPPGSKLHRWAKDKGISVWYLVNKAKYAKAHPFMVPAMEITSEIMPGIISKYSDKALHTARLK